MADSWRGRAIVAGHARGAAMISATPISFLGDVDITSGRIVGSAQSLLGRVITGAVLIVPATSGSAGAWRFLYQLSLHGTQPAALIVGELPDPSVVQGAILADIPVLAGLDDDFRATIVDGQLLDVDGETVRIVGQE